MPVLNIEEQKKAPYFSNLGAVYRRWVIPLWKRLIFIGRLIFMSVFALFKLPRSPLVRGARGNCLIYLNINTALFWNNNMFFNRGSYGIVENNSRIEAKRNEMRIFHERRKHLVDSRIYYTVQHEKWDTIWHIPFERIDRYKNLAILARIPEERSCEVCLNRWIFLIFTNEVSYHISQTIQLFSTLSPAKI